MDLQSLINIITGAGLAAKVTCVVMITVFPIQTAIAAISFVLSFFGWYPFKRR